MHHVCCIGELLKPGWGIAPCAGSQERFVLLLLLFYDSDVSLI